MYLSPAMNTLIENGRLILTCLYDVNLQAQRTKKRFKQVLFQESSCALHHGSCFIALTILGNLYVSYSLL